MGSGDPVCDMAAAKLSMSSQDSHGLHGSRQGMGYGRGSFSGSDVGGMYSSSGYGGDYLPRGADVGGISYPPMYSSRGMGGSYMGGGGGSGSHY